MVKNCHIETMPDGSTYYYSYRTLIGLYSPRLQLGARPIFTGESHSPTTSRHRAAFERLSNGIRIAAADFDRYVQLDKERLVKGNSKLAKYGDLATIHDLKAELERERAALERACNENREDKRVLVDQLLDAQRRLGEAQGVIQMLMEQAN